jgi:hypothetical protein
MIVVSNTSPLTNLAAIGQFALFHQLYGRLHIAEGVWEEMNARGQHWPCRDEVATADWVERHTVQNQALVTALRRDLDKGEAETIALALELGANLVLLANAKDGMQPRGWNFVSSASSASCWRPSHRVLWTRFALIWTPCGTRRVSTLRSKSTTLP